MRGYSHALWCRAAVGVALFVSVHGALAESSESWLEVPTADFAALEPAVAEQLTELRAYVEERAADSEVPGPKLAEAVGELGQHYHAYSLAEPAERCYRIASRLAPEDIRWPYLLGYLMHVGGRLEEAAALYEKVLLQVPEVSPALIRLGQVYLDLNRQDEARSVLERALELEPGSAAAAATLGQVLLAEKRYAAAADQLKAALEMQPEATRLHYPLGLAYRGLGDLERAGAHLARRGEVGVRPADPLVDQLTRLTTGERVHLLRGQRAFEAQDYEAATLGFEQALAAAPGSIRARLNLASALAETGRVGEAVEHLRQVVEMAPGNATAHYNLALLYQRRDEAAAALDHLREAALFAPDDAEVNLRLADALRASGELDSALEHYVKSVAAGPANEFARIGEADVLTRLGRYPEAIERLEAAHRQMPDRGSVAHALARLLAGCPDGSLRDGARALELAERVFDARPTVRHLRTVAMAHAELGSCDLAAEWIGKALATAAQAGAQEGVAELLEVRERYLAGPPCRPPVDRGPAE